MNPILRASLKCSYQLFKTVGVKPTAFTGMLCSFPHKKFNKTDKEVAWAKGELKEIYDDCNNSCITSENLVSSEYDLHIIIPAYNVDNYIEKCLESAIAAQNGKYKVLITVVNDGSTDSTSEILKKYSVRKDIEIINQGNRGFSGARNRALQNIRGRYVTFLDSDDELGDINSLLSEAFKYDADIAEGSYEKFHDNRSRYVKAGNVDSDHGGHGVLHGFPWGKVYKNSVLKNLCFPESYWFEDTIGIMILNDIVKKVIKRDILCYRYRINPNGISMTFKGKAKSVDSHWITERLMKDRDLLGLDNNNPGMANMLATQVRRNYLRISKIKKENIELVIFLISRDLFNRYIPSYGGDALRDNQIIQSLKEGDFLKFKIACILGI